MADPSRPMPSSFDGNEQFTNENGIGKFTKKIKEEPLIPLGLGLTVYALVGAARSLRRGDSHAAQRFFRLRVLFQGLTVVAMVAGGAYYAEARTKTRDMQKLELLKREEEKRDKWIRELEARDEEDKAEQRALEARRAARQEQIKLEEEKEKAAAAEASGVLAKLGLRKSTPMKEGGTLKEKVKAAEEGLETGRKKNPKSSLGSLGEIVSIQSKKDSSSKSDSP